MRKVFSRKVRQAIPSTAGRYGHSPGRSIVASLVLSLGFAAAANGQVPLAADYNKLIRSGQVVQSLGENLLGERVDLFTGRTDFVATDVSLPGNSALPVAVSRRFSVEARGAGAARRGLFGDWDLEIPHIEFIGSAAAGWVVDGPAPNARCNQFGPPPSVVINTPLPSGGSVSTTIDAAQYTMGAQLVIPGEGKRELLRRASTNQHGPTGALGSYVNYPVVTNDWWMLSCINLSPTSNGEGFRAYSPDGTNYRFDRLVFRPYSTLMRPADTTTTGVNANLDRSSVWLMASRVEDRHGNWVEYDYDGVEPWRLVKIRSSDSRVINVTYQGGRVRTVSDTTRTWTYNYLANGSLDSVVLPDSSRWEFGLSNLYEATWNYPTNSACNALGSATSSGATTGTIKAPTGALGTFTFGLNRRGRNGAPTTCFQNSGGGTTSFANVEPVVYDVLALTQKKITGPQLSQLDWDISYAGCTSTSCNQSVTTLVKDPEKTDTRYTFGARFADDEGMLQKIERGGTSGGSFLWTESYEYFSATGQSWPAIMGAPAQSRGDLVRQNQLRPVFRRTINVQGTNFVRTASSPDTYGFPQSITRTGSATKIDSLTYGHNTGKWILGTLKKSISGGQTEFEYSLNAENLPYTVSQFGLQVATLDYHADGQVSWIRDSGSQTTSYSNYYRGIPRLIQYADTSSESAEVSNIGAITSWTDEEFATTTFLHDQMGRVRSITYPPGGQTTGWAGTTLVWSTSSSGWTLTKTTGGYQEITTFDALLRPVRSNYDATRYINREFDSASRPTFISFPDSSSGASAGNDYEYDRLGRLTRDEESGGYVSTNNYNTGFTLTARNRRNFSTTYTFKTYDEPLMRWPMTINGPEHNTTFTRDAWGKPESVVRGGGQVRRWFYGAGQRLCGIHSPERGGTAFTYDAAGNLKTHTDAGSGVGCFSTNANTVNYFYDSRNRLTSVNYPGTTDDLTQTWYKNGLLDTADTEHTQRKFEYNDRRMPTLERITFDGAVRNIRYEYNNDGNRSAMVYPDGMRVEYSPNSFGEPTKAVSSAASFATGVSYSATGAIAGFAYGNGISHTRTPAAFRPYLAGSSVDSNGVLNFGYQYDGNLNPTQITDNLPGAIETKGMSYDGADRLKTANAANLWNNGVFEYSDDDSLTKATLDGQLTDYDITGGRVQSITRGSETISVLYDDMGNVRQKGKQTYVFDRAGRLNTVTGKASYIYDAFGYRVMATEVGAVSSRYPDRYVYSRDGKLIYSWAHSGTHITSPEKSGAGTKDIPEAWKVVETNYVYLGGSLVAERRTIDNGMIDDPSATVRTVQTVYVHTDGLGGVSVKTAADKSVLERKRYYPYGMQTDGVAAGPGFTGHYMDGTGLIYMKARYYDPELGRFMSTDPVGVSGIDGANFSRYHYANNNPYAYTDPDGRVANFVIGAFVGAAVDAAAQYTLTGEVKLSGVAAAALVGAATSGTSALYMSAARTGALSVTQATVRASGSAFAYGVAGSAVESGLEGEMPVLEKMALAGVANMMATGLVASATFKPNIAPLSGVGASSPNSIRFTVDATTQQAIGTKPAEMGASTVALSEITKEGALKLTEFGITTGQKKAEEEIPR